VLRLRKRYRERCEEIALQRCAHSPGNSHRTLLHDAKSKIDRPVVTCVRDRLPVGVSALSLVEFKSRRGTPATSRRGHAQHVWRVAALIVAALIVAALIVARVQVNTLVGRVALGPPGGPAADMSLTG
jgi:hypothetical protein